MNDHDIGERAPLGREPGMNAELAIGELTTRLAAAERRLARLDAKESVLSAYFMTSGAAAGSLQGGQYQGEAVPDGDGWRFRRFRILTGGAGGCLANPYGR